MGSKSGHHKLLMVLLPIFLPSISIGQSILELGDNSLIYSNDTVRPKRQLFREDIPHHRPLSGNHYASQHGFPHPGRWSDGMRSQHLPSGQLPPPHQHYIDMLDGGRHGRYYNKPNPGFPSYLKEPQQPYPGENFGPNSVSFGSDIFNNGGGGGSASFGEGDFGPPQEKPPHGGSFGNNHGSEYGYPGPNEHDSVYDGPGPTKDPHYEQPELIEAVQIPNQPKGHGPKTTVTYHPVQYGKIINLPEKSQDPFDGHNNIAYGPPNHSSGQPIGLSHPESGFIPSKGPHPDEDSKEHYSYQHSHPQHQHHHHQPPSYYQPHPRPHSPPRYPNRFNPFKFYSRPQSYHPPRFNNIEQDPPVAIPILAQFHSPAKPVKFSKFKLPIHLVYGHIPLGRPHHYQNNFYNSQPKPPRWLFQNGL